MPLVLLFCCHTPCWVILLPHALSGRVGQTGFVGSEAMGYKRKKGNSNEWISFFLKRCLAESNRSTRFCRPLPNRSVKTPFVSEATISELRVQRYNFYLVPPNFLATFFKKTFIFCCFSLLLVYFLLFFPCSHSFFAHIAPEMGNWRIYSPYMSLSSGKFYKCN